MNADGASHFPSRKLVAILSLSCLAACTGEVGGPEARGQRRAAASGECASLNMVSATDLISIKNTAYFEASYLDGYRKSECAKVAGTIIGRAAKGGYGDGYQGVISAPYQFEVYGAVRICTDSGCYRLTDGVGVDQASYITRYGTRSSGDAHRAGYADCSAAVEEALRNTPGTIYLNFAAAGNGTNSFRNPVGYPQGCNVIDGEPQGQPEPAPQEQPQPSGGDGEWHTITATHSGKCLDVAGAGTADGTRVWQYHCNGTDAQQWKLVPAGDGTYSLVAKCSGRCLDVPGGSRADGEKLWQYGCNGTDAQKWKLSPSGDGQYSLAAAVSGKCLDVASESTQDGADVIQWPCHGNANQRWTISGFNGNGSGASGTDVSCPTAGASTANPTALGDLNGKPCNYECWGSGWIYNVCGASKWQFCLPQGVFAPCQNQ